MDADLHGAQEVERDRHGWNSLENYTQIHERRLAEHSFVDHSRPNTVAFSAFDNGDRRFIRVAGRIYCHYGVVVDVEKWLETEYRQGRLMVRSFSYRYNASLQGKHNILRYDNNHDFDDYHCHRFDLSTGEPIDNRIPLTRQEFPLLSEVLDKVEELLRPEPAE